MEENTMEAPREQKIDLKISLLQEDLENGLTRCKGDASYVESVGSIEEKYNLTKTEVREIFRHPKLKGLRTIPFKEKRYNLEDDTIENNDFGTPSNAANIRMNNNAAVEESSVSSMEAGSPIVSESIPDIE